MDIKVLIKFTVVEMKKLPVS